ncbi:MAG: VTT domain-containing protein [Acidobacteriota bacterium]|nr:VTT domain-containing protein [Acidobacteriota bacterium]
MDRNSTDQILAFLIRHGYSVVFFWILAEQGAIPLPSIPVLLAAGALIRADRLSGALVLCCAIGACVIADNFWFQLGRHRGASVLRFLCRIALEPDSCVRKTENVFVRYGSRSLLLAKFVPGLNAAAAPLAGISGMSVPRFLIFDVLGSLVWSFSYVGLGFIFSNQLETVAAYAVRTGSWLLLFIAASLGLWIAWKYTQRRKFLRKLAIARITPRELKIKLDAGEDVMIVDLRSALAGEDDSIPGALRISSEELTGRHQEIPRDRDIVLYCS